RVHAVHLVVPEAAHVAHLGALLQLAFLAHLLAKARQLLGHALVQLHHLVEGLGDLALEAGPFHRQAHAAVALAKGREGRKQNARLVLGPLRGGRLLLRLLRAAPRGNRRSGLVHRLRVLHLPAMPFWVVDPRYLSMVHTWSSILRRNFPTTRFIPASSSLPVSSRWIQPAIAERGVRRSCESDRAASLESAGRPGESAAAMRIASSVAAVQITAAASSSWPAASAQSRTSTTPSPASCSTRLAASPAGDRTVRFSKVAMASPPEW